MKRLVIISLLSVLSFGMYAQYAESSYSVISHRQYDALDSYSQSQYGSVHHVTDQNAYQSSYRSENIYQDRVSANTFSSTPSMDMNPLSPSSNDGYSGMGGTRMHSPVRPPQRGIDNEDQEDGDLSEPDTNDPNATPLGDIPWLLLLLLVTVYACKTAWDRLPTDEHERARKR